MLHKTSLTKKARIIVIDFFDKYFFQSGPSKETKKDNKWNLHIDMHGWNFDVPGQNIDTRQCMDFSCL